MKKHLVLFTVLVVLFSIGKASAQIPLTGYFIARKVCPAFQSIKKRTNPGNINTRINHAYDLKAKNKEDASHYWIKMEAEPKYRWVATHCGEHVIPAADVPPTPGYPPTTPPASGSEAKYILAVSWQSAFCETKPGKTECRTQTQDRFDATHFTLHGLWPQPRKNIYCNVNQSDMTNDKDRKWEALPSLLLAEATREELNKVMPGTQSFLHRHEWIKHGTCYQGATADQYYRDSLQLMQGLNNDESAIRNLFADNIGKELTSTQIAQAFNTTFGEGAGKKIKITCKRDRQRKLITEITIGLQGDLDNISMGEAILAAPDANDIGCTKGIVDSVGFQ